MDSGKLTVIRYHISRIISATPKIQQSAAWIDSIIAILKSTMFVVGLVFVVGKAGEKRRLMAMCKERSVKLNIDQMC